MAMSGGLIQIFKKFTVSIYISQTYKIGLMRLYGGGWCVLDVAWLICNKKAQRSCMLHWVRSGERGLINLVY